MALEAFLSTLDGLEDSIAGLYKEHEGGHILDVNNVTTESGAAYGVANYGGLKSALEKERGISSGFKSELAKYSGIDIESATAAIEFQNKYSGKTNDDFEAKLEEIKSGFNDKLAEANKATQDAIAAKNNFQVGHAVDAALMAREDVNPTMAKFLRREILDSVGIDDSGVFVKDGNGNPKMSAQSTNMGNMQVSELIDVMSASGSEYAGFFNPKGAGGGSGKSSNRGAEPSGGRPTTKDAYRSLSQDKQVELYKSDPSYYKSLIDG